MTLLSTLNQLIEQPMLTTKIDKRCMYELMNEKLAYIEIPIGVSDKFRVKILENFVMNRLSGDYMESILYKVFNVLSSSLTVWETAELLDLHVEVVLQDWL